MKYLGVDWGEKRIGLALGDDETKIASPFKTVPDMDGVLAAIRAEEIDAVVLGKPLSISNFEFRISNEFIEFKNDLIKATKVQIIEIDERLSSKAADALSGDKKTKAGRDALAAMIILQSYFDNKS